MLPRGGVTARAVQKRKPFLVVAWPHFPVCHPVRRYHSSFFCPTEGITEDKRRNPGERGRPGRVAGSAGSKAPEVGRHGQQQLQALARGGGRVEAGALSRVLEEMERAGIRAEEKVMLALLQRCKQERNLKASQRVHAHLLRLFSSDQQELSRLATSLIAAYGACGRLDLAREVFHHHQRSREEEGGAAMWNAMMQACTQCGGGKEALQLFQEMEKAGVASNALTFSIVLKACGMAKDLEIGERVHAEVLRRGLLPNVVLSTALISMYGTCGKTEEARAVFQGMKDRNVVTWTSMIAAETQSGRGKEALQLFQQMQEEGVAANAFTFSIVLKACGMAEDLEMGKRVHAEVLRRGLQSSTTLSTALISMYGTCGKTEEARAVFQGMEARNVVTWTSMIAAETQSGRGKEALQLFQEMQQAGVAANAFTFSTVLKACGMTGDVEMGKRVHAELLRKGLLSNVISSNALISMYGKCGKIEEARAVFQGMTERDVSTWNAMIVAETQSGHSKEALQLFQDMEQAGMAADALTFATVLKACAMAEDVEMGKRVHAEMLRRGSLSISEANALISMYGKCGQVEEARTVFQSMKERDVVTWNSMIAEETQSGDGKKALKLFQEMEQAGVPADTFTFSVVLRACATTADLKTGKQVHAELLRKGLLPNVVSSNALISMYGKCGEPEEACKVFKQMKERDVITWNALIAMHGLHGQGKEALAALREMQDQGVEPDAITFINVLNACSHAGLVEEGLACFAAMRAKHNIQPTTDHFNCMVDLLGRAGRLEEAETLIRTMETTPDAVTWMTLLGACRGAKDVERAERAAKQAIALNPMDAAPFVVLSNILAAAGRWEEMERVRKEMKERKVKKEPGRSWITVDGEVHSFVVKDRNHPRSAEIYHHLDQLNQQMKAAGYQPDLNWVLHDVADEQKEEELCHHSEKLAIAFGLMATPPGQPLQIMKNLRVCGDCHTATKFIAKVSQREILVRDANRFHRFSPDGRCSCGDYW